MESTQTGVVCRLIKSNCVDRGVNLPILVYLRSTVVKGLPISSHVELHKRRGFRDKLGVCALLRGTCVALNTQF